MLDLERVELPQNVLDDLAVISNYVMHADRSGGHVGFANGVNYIISAKGGRITQYSARMPSEENDTDTTYAKLVEVLSPLGVHVLSSPFCPLCNLLMYTREIGVIGMVEMDKVESYTTITVTVIASSQIQAAVESMDVNDGAITVKRMSLSADARYVVFERTKPTLRPAPERIMDLYPFLDESPRELMSRFMESSSNVLLFMGEPGLGKSSFISEMIKIHAELTGKQLSAVVCDEPKCYEHPGFIKAVRNLKPGRLFVSEDTTKACQRREGGNDLMSSLLNITDGIVGTTTKFIFSTNLVNLNDVDPALVRPGRTMAILRFRKLTRDEGNVARMAIGKEPVDFTRDEVTLSEALNWEEVSPEGLRKSGFGFMRQE